MVYASLQHAARVERGQRPQQQVKKQAAGPTVPHSTAQHSTAQRSATAHTRVVVNRQQLVCQEEGCIGCGAGMRRPPAALRFQLVAQVANQAAPKVKWQGHCVLGAASRTVRVSQEGGFECRVRS